LDFPGATRRPIGAPPGGPLPWRRCTSSTPRAWVALRSRRDQATESSAPTQPRAMSGPVSLLDECARPDTPRPAPAGVTNGAEAAASRAPKAFSVRGRARIGGHVRPVSAAQFRLQAKRLGTPARNSPKSCPPSRRRGCAALRPAAPRARPSRAWPSAAGDWSDLPRRRKKSPAGRKSLPKPPARTPTNLPASPSAPQESHEAALVAAFRSLKACYVGRSASCAAREKRAGVQEERRVLTKIRVGRALRPVLLGRRQTSWSLLQSARSRRREMAWEFSRRQFGLVKTKIRASTPRARARFSASVVAGRLEDEARAHACA